LVRCHLCLGSHSHSIVLLGMGPRHPACMSDYVLEMHDLKQKELGSIYARKHIGILLCPLLELLPALHVRRKPLSYLCIKNTWRKRLIIGRLYDARVLSKKILSSSQSLWLGKNRATLTRLGLLPVDTSRHRKLLHSRAYHILHIGHVGSTNHLSRHTLLLRQLLSLLLCLLLLLLCLLLLLLVEEHISLARLSCSGW
jgi:hypothetical protein